MRSLFGTSLRRLNKDQLLTTVAMPLYDGFYACSFLKDGQYKDLLSAIFLLIIAFSGAACISVTWTNLKYNNRQKRLQTIVYIYAVVLAGAVLEALLLPLIQNIILPDINLFTAIFLIGLALKTTNHPHLKNFVKKMSLCAAVAVGLMVSFLDWLAKGLKCGIVWFFVDPLIACFYSFDVNRFREIALVTIVGITIACIVTIVGVEFINFLGKQYTVGDDESSSKALNPLNLASAFSILIVAFKILGVNVPGYIPFIVLASGVLFTKYQNLLIGVIKYCIHLVKSKTNSLRKISQRRLK